jgi:hypothetical protein
MYRVILSVLDRRKCEYLKDYSLDFEHAYMTKYMTHEARYLVIYACSKSNEYSLRYSHFLGFGNDRITLYFVL